jgi:uncharacterized protein (TIGR00369 family)
LALTTCEVIDSGSADRQPGVIDAITPTRRELIAEFVPASPLVRHLGIRLVEVGDDRAVLELPFDPRLATAGEVVHGGAIASLIDTAGMAAAWSDQARPESLRGATVSMHVDYLAAATGTDLRADACVVRRGGTLCFCEVEVTDAGGEAVARGSVIHRYG